MLNSLSACLSPLWLATRYLRVKLCSLQVEQSLRKLDICSLCISDVCRMSANNLVRLSLKQVPDEDKLLFSDKGEEGSVSIIKASFRLCWLSDWSDMMKRKETQGKMRKKIKRYMQMENCCKSEKPHNDCKKRTKNLLKARKCRKVPSLTQKITGEEVALKPSKHPE